jgi:hypothetical protein
MERVKNICSNITMSIFGIDLNLLVELDKEYGGRVYLQVEYTCPCTKTGESETWRGGKWYLSKHMTDDEIVKKAYAAFEAAVKHEVMEGFKFNGIILFNPHVDFRELLLVSHREVRRTPQFQEALPL